MRSALRAITLASVALAALLTASCGGGTGTERDSGANKTTLRVQASDADGDALQYQWRVTAGTVDNRNTNETVWTLPDGPGLHFAYVTVSDGRGGYAEQQYAVSTDALGVPVATRAAAAYEPRAVSDFSGSALRLRVSSPDATLFTPPAGGTALARTVYLPDVSVKVSRTAGGALVFSGVTDLSGEVSLPKLEAGQNYTVQCTTNADAAPVSCGSFPVQTTASAQPLAPQLDDSRNLRLYGHVAGSDGAVCGAANEFFGLQSAATVRLLQADGTALTPAVRANRFGDYALDAAVAVDAALKLEVRCDGYQKTVDVPAAAGGYRANQPVELSHVVANSRPVVVKMVANGPDGNVRGRMIVAETGALSNGLPGAQRFLTYKGLDTRRSACMYYRALGAVKDCDAQGNMIEPITLDDWRRRHNLAPYNAGNTEVAADYINKMDLNLVRRMVATKNAADSIAFVVCNHPGPEGSSQTEVDQVIDTALAGERLVACVAMEWTTSPGVNGGKAFTKFLTFGPDGALIPSVNLDGRGEKYLPGACVACHGGTQYNGRFPDKGDPSPYLGAGFLPFDTGNYYFGSRSAQTESTQGAAIHGLNRLVFDTEGGANSNVTRLINGWYASGTDTLDKAYVPPNWVKYDSETLPGAARLYREVVGSSCRTCHASLGSRYDWDTTVLDPGRARAHVCGGTPDLMVNASMPNALISRDRVSQRVQADPALAALMTSVLGCSTPLPDPVYPSR